MKKIAAFLLINCTFLLPLQLPADEVFKPFSVGRFDAFVDTNYLKSLANYGPGGDRVDLPANSSLQLVQLKTIARYLIFNDVGIYTGLNFNNIESFNGLNSRANSVLSHYILGGDYQLFQTKTWSLYADVSYYLSHMTVNVNQDDSLPSDGASELRALLVGTLSLDTIRSFAKIGYDQRSDGLSALMLYGAGIEYAVTPHSTVGAELNGSSSIKDDQFTATPLLRDTLTDRVNAGSRVFYSINPNLLAAELYLAYSFDPNFSIKLKGGRTLIGSNSAEGYHAGISAIWGFGGRGNMKAQNRKPEKFIENSTAISDEDPGFRIDTDDGVNQDLFKPVEPVKPKK